MSNDILRIANCSGFYGDRLSAAREMVQGGPIDVLTGDYLAELTMMILFKDRMKHPGAGYAAYAYLCEAIRHYARADALAEDDNDDAVLRHNTCVRMIQRYGLVAAAPDERELPLE